MIDLVFPADPVVGDAKYDAGADGNPEGRFGYRPEAGAPWHPCGADVGVKGGTGLGTAMDSAATDAPAITGFDGVALEKDGPGPITQMALVPIPMPSELGAGVRGRVPVQRNR